MSHHTITFLYLYTFTGNPYLTDAIACHANESEFAWIGAYPGVKVRKLWALHFGAF